MFSRKTAGQLLARINSLALPREALESATLLPNSTLPVLTAIRICLFTSNWGLLAPFPRHRHGDLYETCAHWYLLTDDHVLGNAPEGVYDSFHGSVYDGRNCDLEGCLGKCARFLSADTVASDLENFARRGHHVSYYHHVSNVHVESLFLQYPYRFFDYYVSGCFDPENDGCLVDVVADCSACVNAWNLKGQGEAGALCSDYPFTLLLDNESSSDSRQALDMIDEQFPGQPSELGDLELLRLDLHVVSFDFDLAVRRFHRLPYVLDRDLSFSHSLRVQFYINPHPGDIGLECAGDVP